MYFKANRLVTVQSRDISKLLSPHNSSSPQYCSKFSNIKNGQQIERRDRYSYILTLLGDYSCLSKTMLLPKLLSKPRLFNTTSITANSSDSSDTGVASSYGTNSEQLQN